VSHFFRACLSPHLLWQNKAALQTVFFFPPPLSSTHSSFRLFIILGLTPFFFFFFPYVGPTRMGNKTTSLFPHFFFFFGVGGPPNSTFSLFFAPRGELESTCFSPLPLFPFSLNIWFTPFWSPRTPLFFFLPFRTNVWGKGCHGSFSPLFLGVTRS